ncbi:hypothetical protein [Xanthomonas theicola]|uniref:hypothetical protein n=1 Tax=Xanthomonas theicola TaxID=56464 RepID=UPI001FE997AC|nr:hypothetical protein [Xanthomonas theicola]
MLLKLKPLQRANLGVAVNVAEAAVQAGDTIRYSVEVGNGDPDAARFAAIAFAALDAALAPALTAARGRDCTAPQLGAQTRAPPAPRRSSSPARRRASRSQCRPRPRWLGAR